ncbi:MAG: uracil-DNA glycosylase [Rhodospirillales bacterium]
MTQTATDPIAVKALLQWYLEAGIDEVIVDVPQDRFAEQAQALAAARAAKAAGPAAGPGLSDGPMPGAPQGRGPVASVRGPLTKPQSPAQVSDQAAVKDAVAMAGKAETLEDLRTALEGFDGCALKTTASNLCFYDGNPKARVLFVGEAPGAEEDRQGLPFVGPSGKLLDAMLASIGLDRHGEGDAAALISNTVFWRPPGNRTPTPSEAAICQPFVERLIEIVQPRALVCVGGPSAKALLEQTLGITRLRGKWFDYATAKMAGPIPAMALYHPAYLLRSPAMKRDAWRDLLMLKAKLTGGGGD